MLKNIYQTKIEQSTIDYCGGNCSECKCTETECIDNLYYVLHAHEDV